MTPARKRLASAIDYTPVSAPTTDPGGNATDALAVLRSVFTDSRPYVDQRGPAACTYPLDVVVCESPGPGRLCRNCSLLELGERGENLSARTNAGTPKGKFYKELTEAQARPDPEFARVRRIELAHRVTG